MTQLRVRRSVAIAKPPGIVRAQFADVAHHERTDPHRGVRFEVVADDGRVCRYRQVSAIGPLRLRQEFELARTVDGPLVNRIVAGPLVGGEIRFAVEPLDDDAGASRVTATVQAELTGAEALAHRVLRRRIGRSLEAALVEDRDDLESGDYERSASPGSAATG